MTHYDADFYSWTQEQAAALRRLAAQRSNVDLDLENLAEEVESMGRDQAHAVMSALTTIIEHLLKLEFSPAADPRRGWRLSVLNARDDLDGRLEDNPSLATPNKLAELAAKAWKHGRKRTVGALRLFGEADAATQIPTDCPYSIEQLASSDWWPANRTGLVD